MLCIDEAQFSRISHDCKNCAEQIFLLLHSWVCEKRPTIAELCSVLGANTITLTTSDSTCQVYEEQLSDQQYGELLTIEELNAFTVKVSIRSVLVNGVLLVLSSVARAQQCQVC